MLPPNNNNNFAGGSPSRVTNISHLYASLKDECGSIRDLLALS